MLIELHLCLDSIADAEVRQSGSEHCFPCMYVNEIGA